LTRNNVFQRRSYESCAFTGLNVLEVGYSVNTALVFERCAFTNVACQNLCHNFSPYMLNYFFFYYTAPPQIATTADIAL
jgi:hypothetical protein